MSQAYTYTDTVDEIVPPDSFGTVAEFELPAGTYVVSAIVDVFNPDTVAVVDCRLASGSQFSSRFMLAYTSGAIPLLASFELDTAANVELQCRFTPAEVGGSVIVKAYFVTTQVDSVTEIEDGP